MRTVTGVIVWVACCIGVRGSAVTRLGSTSRKLAEALSSRRLADPEKLAQVITILEDILLVEANGRIAQAIENFYAAEAQEEACGANAEAITQARNENEKRLETNDQDTAQNDQSIVTQQNRVQACKEAFCSTEFLANSVGGSQTNLAAAGDALNSCLTGPFHTWQALETHRSELEAQKAELEAQKADLEAQQVANQAELEAQQAAKAAALVEKGEAEVEAAAITQAIGIFKGEAFGASATLLL